MRRKRFQNISASSIVIDGQRYMRGDTFIAAYHPGAEAALVQAGTLRVIEAIDPEEAPPVPRPPATAPARALAPPTPGPSAPAAPARADFGPGALTTLHGEEPVVLSPTPAPAGPGGQDDEAASTRGRRGKKS